MARTVTAKMTPRSPGNPFRDSIFVLGRYVRAQFVIAAILAVLYAIGFAIARVPLWPVIAIIGGFANFVPFVGSLVPLLLAAMTIGWVEWNLNNFLIAFAAWLVIQALEGFYITPRLLSKPLGLRAWPVFLALLAGSFLFGPLGLFFAVPLLAVGAVFYRYLVRDRPKRM